MDNDKLKSKNTDVKAPWPKICLGKSQRKDLRKAFNIFDSAGKGLVSIDIVKIALRVLGYDLTKNQFENLAVVCCEDSEEKGMIDLRKFEQIMEDRMLIRDSRMDSEKSFELILGLSDSSGQRCPAPSGGISTTHLRRVADYLGEDITDDEIDEMIELVSGDQTTPVALADFLRIVDMVKPPRHD